MELQELKTTDLKPQEFIEQKIQELQAQIDGPAVNALSGGVDSAVVTLLGFKALGENLKT